MRQFRHGELWLLNENRLEGREDTRVGFSLFGRHDSGGLTLPRQLMMSMVLG